MIQNLLKSIFRTSENWKKMFQTIWGRSGTKFWLWKKKLWKLLGIPPKSHIFEISIVGKSAECGRNRPIDPSKDPVCSKVSPEFFISPNSKNSPNYLKKITPPQKDDFFFGRKGKIIKCRFQTVWFSMLNITFQPPDNFNWILLFPFQVFKQYLWITKQKWQTISHKR